MSKILNVIQNKEPWYANGLRFKCTGCGQCCTGAPGYIWVTKEEIHEIANFLKLNYNDFLKNFVRKVNDRYSLIELPKSYDCIFLKDKKCQIYPVRPTQCRTFPWWPQNLKSEKDWRDAAKHCEGINPNAPLIPSSTIQEQLSIQENTYS